MSGLDNFLSGHKRLSVAAVLFFIALLAVAVYSNTFTATFQFDDYLYVVDYSSAYRPESFWPTGSARQ